MKKILFILGVLLVFPFKVNATSGSVVISCNKTSLIEAESTTCTLSGSSDGAVNGLTLKLTGSGNITISNIVTSSAWSGNASGGTIDLYTDENKPGSFSIATFTLTAGSAGSGTITSLGEYSDADYNLFAVSGSKNVTIAKKQTSSSSSGTTSGSGTSGSATKPSGSTSTNNNQNNVNNSQSNNNSKPAGENKVPVVTKSSDATLKIIEIINEDIPLIIEDGIFDYSFEVPESSEKIEINTETNDDKATVILPEDLSLEIGENILEIIVEAEDGTKQTYTLNVTRLEGAYSENSLLSSLKIEGYSINFDSNTYEYDLGDIKEKTLNITYKTADDRATVLVFGNKNLGKNDEIIIEVTAENGNISNYILKVNNTKSNVNYLLIVSELLLIASLGVNIYLIVKSRKK